MRTDPLALATAADRRTLQVGVNVYLWGNRSQDRLLTTCLGPAVRELRRRSLLRHFWFDRYDARGPHIMAVFDTLNGGRTLQDRLAARLDAHLESHPCTTPLAAGELRARDAACRGRVLCPADALPGFAANNTYRFFVHEPGGPAFAPGAWLPAAGELWHLLDDLALWTIDRLREDPVAAAVRWIVALDRALGEAGAAAADFWRHHATTLILPLAERLATAEREVLACLPELAGENNLRLYRSVHASLGDPDAVWPHTRRLVDVVLTAGSRPATWRRALLREIKHGALKQLGLPVAQQIPLVLCAWLHNLDGSPRARELRRHG